MPQRHESVTSKSRPLSNTLRDVGVVSILYFVAGKAGLAVPYTSGNVSLVWPAAGFAVAALVIRGYYVWPGIALGAFLVNFFSPIPHVAAFGIGAGNALGPLVVAWLLNRRKRGRLTRLSDLGWFIACALPGTALSAALGTTTLFLTGVRAWQSVPEAWVVWWLGDSMGVLLVLPLVLHAADLRLSRSRAAELAGLLVALVLLAALLFSGNGVREEVLGFAVLPFVIWGAIRFNIAGAALTSCTVSGVAVWATSHGSGPFARYGARLYGAGLLQAFIATVSISGLSLAAVIAERYATEQALAREEDLRRAEEALRQSDKLAALGRLAATISHEVNNPLAACVNLAHLIGRKNLDPETKNHVGLLEQELLRVATITKRTLGFVRESSERVKSSMPRLLDETLALYEQPLRRKGIQVVKEYRTQAEMHVFPGEMRQIFANLITNATDAMDGGTLTITLDHAVHNATGGIRIEFEDTGCGIPTDSLPYIFDPFFTTKQNSGTGLGLWVTRELIEKHGGSISAANRIASHHASGSIFSIWLPTGQPGENGLAQSA